MVVMIILAQLYGVLQLAVLGWAARSIRWRVLVVAVLAGLYGASVLALAVQEFWTRIYADLSGTPLHKVTAMAGYTIDPFIEEIAKLVPVILVFALFPTIRRQWGSTDLVLACAAVGSGFGLAEQLLRFANDADRAIASSSGGWVLPSGILSIQSVPGPTSLLGSWLPAGVGGFSLFGHNAADAINIHLVWSTVAGLGLALLLRSATLRARLFGVGLIALTGLDHAANNAQFGGATARALAEPFTAVRQLAWLYPLIALGTAIWLDRRVLRHELSSDPALRLAAESADPVTSTIELTSVSVRRLPWSWLAVTGFVRLRRAVLYAATHNPAGSQVSIEATHQGTVTQTLADAPTEPTAPLGDTALRAALDRLIGSLNIAAGPAGPQIWAHVAARMRERHGWAATRGRIGALRMGTGEGGRRGAALVLLWLVLLILPIGYFLIGGQPALSGVQNLYEDGGLFIPTVVVSIAAGLWTGWTVLAGLRALPSLRGQPLADRSASAGLLLLMRAGILVLVVVGLLAVARGTPGDGHLVPTSHILDAVGNALLVAGLLLAILALITAPPLGLVAIAGGGSMLVWTGVSAALASDLVIAGVVGGVGLLLNEAAEASGGGSGSGSGSGSGGKTPTERLFDNPKQVRGRPPDEVERLLDDTLDPKAFTKAPVKKGTGTRWFDKNGNSFTVERQPQVGGSLHSGWYLKVAYRGHIVRIPLAGNPALGGP